MDTLREIVKHHSLVDIWHDHHPDDTSTFTFVWVEAHRSSHSRLDRIYLSRFHLSRAHSSSIRLAPFSDHHLATVTASLCAKRPGPAYWHFNNSLLEDEGFVTSFRDFWLAWRGQRCAFPSARRCGTWRSARPAFLPRLHPGQQPTEKCGDRAAEMGGLRAGEPSGRQPQGPTPLRSVPGEARGAPGPRGPSGPGCLCSIPHPPPSGAGSQLPLLLCPGENEGGQETCYLPPGRGRHPPHGTGGDVREGP
ncbi:unnamed protein product [Natator depressus]